jgi:hypothetical protein
MRYKEISKYIQRVQDSNFPRHNYNYVERNENLSFHKVLYNSYVKTRFEINSNLNLQIELFNENLKFTINSNLSHFRIKYLAPILGKNWVKFKFPEIFSYEYYYYITKFRSKSLKQVLHLLDFYFQEFQIISELSLLSLFYDAEFKSIRLLPIYRIKDFLSKIKNEKLFLDKEVRNNILNEIQESIIDRNSKFSFKIFPISCAFSNCYFKFDFGPFLIFYEFLHSKYFDIIKYLEIPNLNFAISLLKSLDLTNAFIKTWRLYNLKGSL